MPCLSFWTCIANIRQWLGWLGWYAISTEAAPVLCGSVGFKGPPNEAGMVEIGYSLLPDYQGHGLASEMVRGLIDWALRQSKVRVIEAETAPDNHPSIRVLNETVSSAWERGAREASCAFEDPFQRKDAKEIRTQRSSLFLDFPLRLCVRLASLRSSPLPLFPSYETPPVG